MAKMSLEWKLASHGWADCTIADDRAEAEVTASHITEAPEGLLIAVTRQEARQGRHRNLGERLPR